MEKQIAGLAQKRSEVDEIGNLVQFYLDIRENYLASAKRSPSNPRVDWDEILLLRHRTKKILKFVIPNWLVKTYTNCRNKLFHHL